MLDPRPRNFRQALMCMEYRESGEAKKVLLFIPTGCPEPKAQRLRDEAEDYTHIEQALQDFWKLASAEAPDGEFMWLVKGV